MATQKGEGWRLAAGRRARNHKRNLWRVAAGSGRRPAVRENAAAENELAMLDHVTAGQLDGRDVRLESARAY